VTKCDSNGLTLANGTQIAAATLVWGAGVMASPAAKWLKQPQDRAGRVQIGADLKVPGHPNVFVIGDTASVMDGAGQAVPGVAPAAKQMGWHAVRTILDSLAGKTTPPFVYRDYGNLATIGHKSAVADFGRLKFSGLPAWVLWSLAHIWFLIGFRNRLAVFTGWAWSYFTHDRHARIITGGEA
jgi:NADH dehydrogenase